MFTCMYKSSHIRSRVIHVSICSGDKAFSISFVSTQSKETLRSQNNVWVKIGNLAQGGEGGSDPIPTFINHCFYGTFHPFLLKISDKLTEKISTFGEGGGGGQVGWAKFPTFTKKLFWGLP